MNRLRNNDEIYVTNLSTGDFTTLINKLIQHQTSLEISLYVKECQDEVITFVGTNSKLSTLLFDGGAIKSIYIYGSKNFLLIDNNSEILTKVSFNGNKLDLSGCSNVKLTTSTTQWNILKLNGCSEIELGTIQLDSNTKEVDFTDINSVQDLNFSNITNGNNDNNIILSALKAKVINKIKFSECDIPAIDLSITNTLDLDIIDSKCDDITLPQDMNSLVISNLTNEISINSTKNLSVQNCNVSCGNVNLESDSSSAISIKNSGIIGSVNASNLSNISIALEKCEKLNINGCANIICSPYFFTTATDSLTIKNSTFHILSIDFESTNVDVSGMTMSGQNMTLNIRNYNGTTEDLGIDSHVSLDSCSIWCCPNIDLSNIKSNVLYLIELPIIELPSIQVSDIIFLYNCHKITSISGNYESLIAINCSSLKEVDVSNMGVYRLVWNQSLDTIIKDGTTYGNSGELIDNLLTSPTDAYGKLLRFNAFRNLEIYSAPNIINGKLIYNNQYNIIANTNTDVADSITNSDKNKNMSYTGLCTLGRDVTSDYSAGLGDYFIWIDFTNISTSSFTNPANICGYNMNPEVKNELIDTANRYNLIYPITIITDIPSSSFNNKNILVLSTSDLKPTPSDTPNVFNIKLIV